MAQLLEFFRLSHATLDETKRGLLNNIIVSMIGMFPEMIFMARGTSSDSIYTIYDLVMSTTLGFIFDVMFANDTGFCTIANRKNLTCEGVNMTSATMSGGGISPLMHLCNSMAGIRFMKFIITVIINMMITLPLYIMWINQNPKATVFMRRIVKTIIGVVAFISYVNILQFDWAYRGIDDSRTVHDLIIVVFLVASCMTFLNSPNANPGEEGSIVMNPKSKLAMVITGLILISVYQLIVGTPFLRNFSYGDSYIPGLVVICIIFFGGTAFLFSPAAIDKRIEKLQVDWRDWVFSACVTLTGIVMITSLIMYIIATSTD